MAKFASENAQILKILKEVPLFQGFREREKDLSVLAAVMTTREVAAGRVVVKEGELGEELFILQSGRVEITRNTLQNEQYTVAVLGGEGHPFFGEFALVDSDRRSATIKALEKCRLLILKRGDFERLGNEYPHIGLVIMRELAKTLSHRFRDTNEDVILLFEALVKEVSQKTVD